MGPYASRHIARSISRGQAPPMTRVGEGLSISYQILETPMPHTGRTKLVDTSNNGQDDAWILMHKYHGADFS